MTRWIIHADDFGETEEITKGIVEAMLAGSVTSTSIMANMPGTEYGLAVAQNWSGPHSFGVHINLCEESPLTDAPSLCDSEGRFLRKRALFLQSIKGQLRPDELEREICAQVSRVADAGISISHFDGHKHLHQLPTVRDAVAKTARKFGVERIRVTKAVSSWRNDAGFVNALSGFVRNRLSLRAAKTFESHHLRFPELFIDIRDLMNEMPGNPFEVPRVHGGAVAEVFCHPGTKSADIEKPGSCARFDELKYLLSDRFRDLCDRESIQLVNFWEV